MKDKKSIISETAKKTGFVIKNTLESLQSTGKAFVLYTIALVFMFGVFAVTVFLAFNKGKERVLVPNVIGNNIYSAQLILQEKELYPRLQMRYSDIPGQAGLIIDQSPKADAVVKASSRVTLVVSRGIVFDHVGNYIGTNIDALKTTLDALYAGASIPSVTIANPIFKQDASLPGTILEQDPPEGTPITQPIELKLVVSSGNEKIKVAIPDCVGKTLPEFLSIMASTNLCFDITQHIATGSEVPGTIVKQTNPNNKNEASEYSRVQIEFAMPEVTDEIVEEKPVVDVSNKTEAEAAEDVNKRDMTNYVHGVITTKIPEYPYAIPVKVDVIPQEGSRYGFATFNHIGGEISIPYAVPHGSVLVLSVLNKEVEKIAIQ